MAKWYNLTTFDVIGDLVFAQSFGCLGNSEYHPWVSTIFSSVREGAKATGPSYLGLVGFVDFWVGIFIPKLAGTHRENMQGR